MVQLFAQSAVLPYYVNATTLIRERWRCVSKNWGQEKLLAAVVLAWLVQTAERTRRCRSGLEGRWRAVIAVLPNKSDLQSASSIPPPSTVIGERCCTVRPHGGSCLAVSGGKIGGRRKPQTTLRSTFSA